MVGVHENRVPVSRKMAKPRCGVMVAVDGGLVAQAEEEEEKAKTDSWRAGIL